MSSGAYRLFAFIALCGAAQAGNYQYDAGSPTCTGTTGNLCGPAYWGNVAGNELCTNTGASEQTPIDFSNVELDAELEGPEFEAEDGGCEDFEAAANDHAYEVNFGSESCTNLKLTYEGTVYTFLQFHFHSPSEHTVAGAHFSAEAHMVHSDADGNLLVVGVFLQEAESSFTLPNNTFLDSVWGGRSMKEISDGGVVNAGTPMNPYTSFTPGSLKQYVYEGSLTTPPCTEGVQWLVYTDPVYVSSDDVRIIRGATALYPGTVISSQGNDNRPVQPLNGRTVKMSTGLNEAADANSNNDDKDAKKSKTAIIIGSIALAFIGIVVIFIAVFLLMRFMSPAKPKHPLSAPTSGQYELTSTNHV